MEARKGRSVMETRPVALTFRNNRRVAFRSTLEARWALYFDNMGFNWQYEPFRFLLGNKQMTYTPDFKVEGIGIIEIKPYFDAFADSILRLSRYVEKSGERVNLFYGSAPKVVNVAVLANSPLEALFCDDLQRLMVLCGKQRHEAAKEDCNLVRDAVNKELNKVSEWRFDRDALSVQEILLLSDTRTESNEPVARKRAALQRLMKRAAKEHAA